ncbi:hypothetical protein AN396_09130 [Candidatus Epulonipiscium fishelsonii]|uniref:Uncharacterized protein n=1 Tax=Candidatus Epulonipiscium fishelsonii TaxID=77094 RepID=A0ACC8X9S1_9FIRM|nr:hypothetical protein AN396_09130 [Epulopiscium sp. SCG-B11WGA-EpuloA1]
MLSPYVIQEIKENDSQEQQMLYRNLRYIDSHNPEHVLILSGDHVYKMDYNEMLTYHKQKGAEL